jgi:uncharacterized protein YndB with AHSA1/START domain
MGEQRGVVWSASTSPDERERWLARLRVPQSSASHTTGARAYMHADDRSTNGARPSSLALSPSQMPRSDYSTPAPLGV